MENNLIYYFHYFHKSCLYFIRYGDETVSKYINFVNKNLQKYFTEDEKIQLKLIDFNYDLMYKFAFEDLPDDINVNNIDKTKMFDFFENVNIQCVKILNFIDK